jgi:hypothetical protein
METLPEILAGIDSNIWKRFINIVSLLILSIVLTPRAMSQCTPPNFAATHCQDAPLLCLNQYCSSTPDISIPCCNGWCGINTIIDNPQFFQFIATSPDVEFEIHVDGCQDGTGLQSAILDACPWDNGNIIDCNPGTPPGGTMVLVANGLTPGQSCWLLIDGSNAAVCDFTITNTSGILDDFELSALLPELTFASDSVVCPGFYDLHLETGSILMDAPGYYWVTGWNGDTLTSSYPTFDFQVPYNTPEGNWAICVRGYSGCDTTNEICIPIEIRSLADRIKDTATLCQNEFPFDWRDQHIVGPGTYNSLSYEGACSFDSIWTVYAYPLPAEGVLDTIVCNFYFEYEGHLYTQSGTYLLTYPGQGSLGCDSTAHLNLELHYIDALVDLHCQHDQMVLKSRINEQDESIDTITFEWYSCTYDSLLSTAPDLFPDANGCFSLIINASSCLDTIISNFDVNPCEDSIQYYAGAGCAGVEMLLITPYTLDEGEQADWLIKIPGMPDLTFEDEDSIYITIPVAGMYEAYVTIHDQDDIRTWVGYFEVVYGPEVSLCCDQSICSDSCTTIVITETHFELFDVGFTNGLSIIANPGTLTLEVCPFEGDPLNYTINHLSYTYLECPGTIVGDSSITINAVDPPIVFIVPFADSLCTYPNDLPSYQWRHCDSTTILSTATCFAPPAYGCYCLEVVNEFGCSYETCYNFFPEATSIIAEDQLRIFPNPTSGLIQITLSGENDFPVSWQLMDAQGKFILAGELTEKVSDVNFYPVAQGICFLKFNFKSKGILVRKIMIE